MIFKRGIPRSVFSEKYAALEFKKKLEARRGLKKSWINISTETEKLEKKYIDLTKEIMDKRLRENGINNKSKNEFNEKLKGLEKQKEIARKKFFIFLDFAEEIFDNFKYNCGKSEPAFILNHFEYRAHKILRAIEQLDKQTRTIQNIINM